jgi:hypothetical protein
MEEFKTRCAELLSRQSENSRAGSLYVMALVAAFAWMMKDRQFQGIGKYFSEGAERLVRRVLVASYDPPFHA